MAKKKSAMAKAKAHHAKRPAFDRKMDECQIAKKVLRPVRKGGKVVIPGYQDWKKNPGKSDIIGVDAPGEYVKGYTRTTNGKRVKVKGHYRLSTPKRPCGNISLRR